MAWTYSTLSTAIQNWTENDGTEFVAEIDTFIMLAEDRLLREADLDRWRKYSTTSLTIGDRFLTKPTDFLIDRWMEITNGSSNKLHLIAKNNSFIAEYWPVVATTALPKFYSDWDEGSFILAPTPDSNYSVELAYTFRPTGLTSGNTTTWLGTNAPRALFNACMVEALTFMKMDATEISAWDASYDRALKGLVQEQMTRQRTSEAETGEMG